MKSGDGKRGRKKRVGNLIQAQRDYIGANVIRTDEELMIARSVTRLLSLGTPKES